MTTAALLTRFPNGVVIRADGIPVIHPKRISNNAAYTQVVRHNPGPGSPVTQPVVQTQTQSSACNDNELPGRYAKAKAEIEELRDEDLLGDLAICEAILKTPASPCYQRSHMREVVRKFEQFITKQKDPDSERDTTAPVSD